MNNNIQYVNLEEGGVFVFGKWLKIGMSYEKVMDLFAEHIKYNDRLPDRKNIGRACITLHDVEMLGFPFSIKIYFENYLLDEFKMRLIPNDFENEASGQGKSTWYELLEYVAERFNSTVKNSLGENHLVRSGKTICYKNEKHILVGSYDRDMIMYEVVLGLK